MKRVLLRLIDFYQRRLSGLKRQPCCRFTPTCSQYAREAIERYGALCGGGLALWRLLRCNPFCRGGYDPVPQSLGPIFKRRRRPPTDKGE
ncbi:MAG TPA: membrane protein insertion efficiency factor YidD [Candidatus Ventrousia excrementavium]|uniref:Putative membrane protein insertion efficiency factor n=1 Tax=Candidatus Ventrousia excrementavium TaxID=2840961 RepID=A0A9D1LME5_9CLOT|nr:membrane protein insertion efficiency factor YidD [Candidatus Ventrousia excrementavium]